jgi:hypothetical protein
MTSRDLAQHFMLGEDSSTDELQRLIDRLRAAERATVERQVVERLRSRSRHVAESGECRFAVAETWADAADEIERGEHRGK